MTRGQLAPKNSPSQQGTSCQRACNGKKTQNQKVLGKTHTPHDA